MIISLVRDDRQLAYHAGLQLPWPAAAAVASHFILDSFCIKQDPFSIAMRFIAGRGTHQGHPRRERDGGGGGEARAPARGDGAPGPRFLKAVPLARVG